MAHHGYRYFYLYWSSVRAKGKAGYAGVAIFSRIKPEFVIAGVGDDALDKHARVLTTKFAKFILVLTYSPNAGGFGDPRDLDTKIAFNKALATKISGLRTNYSGIPLMLGGDLNTAPRPCDWDRRAYQMVTNKKFDPTEFYPGIGAEEVASHNALCRSFTAIDVWIHFNNANPGGFTWWTRRLTP